jgi:hypothetical protein
MTSENSRSMAPIVGRQTDRENRCVSRSEAADNFLDVVVQLKDRWRVIVCRHGIQWIVQHREKGTARRPWRGRHYCTTRKALVRLCGSSCGDVDPAAVAVLEALPENFGGSS